MNFGGNNPPWSRQAAGSGGSYGYGSTTNQFPPQQNIGQPGLAMPTSLSGGGGGSTVSNYPSRSPAAQPAAGNAGAIKQRVFTGSITKVSDNFGFVDDDIFFQTTVCKGGVPKLGDKVLVEATFNANMPFKWNATRIQLIPNQGGAAVPAQQQQQQAAFQQQVTAVQQLNALQQAQITGSTITPVLNQGLSLQHQMHHLAASQQQQHARGPYTSIPPPVLPKPYVPHSRPDGGTGGGSSGGSRTSRFDQRDRRDDRRDRQRSPPFKRRSRSPPPRRRSRSPKARSRSRSPRRKQRTAPRYSVTVPALSLDTKACTVIDLKSRYSNMYIPSDFYHLSLDWVGAFPLHRPFSLGNASKFHICHKDVDPLEPFPDTIDPPDADYTYSAKVMLLAQPSIEDLYKQCCSLAEDSKDEDFTHPTRVLQFLVGMRSKNEPMAIGGPWSPSLDGEDPANNPLVLIKTAIRTTKAMTGIDLSSCTQWYRFVDISYLRAEEVHKGRTIAEHTEHVVMFLPDIWSVVPTMMDYLSLQASHKRNLLIKLGEQEEPQPPPPVEEKPPAADPPIIAATETPPTADNSQSQVTNEEEEAAVNTSAVTEELEEDADTTDKPEATHWSKLEPKTMKVIELRTELEARGLSCKGLKTQLQVKLSKALKVEMEKEEEKEEPAAEEAPKVEEKKEEEETKQSTPAKSPAAKEKTPEPAPVELTKEEKEKKAKDFERLKLHLERVYQFPEEPCIVVHPNRAAKSGKFDCSIMSVSLLLDYRPEDNKEHSFEVSLFAESFNEMLMRDFGFSIYKSMRSIAKNQDVAAAEKKAEDAAAAEAKAANDAAENKAEDGAAEKKGADATAAKEAEGAADDKTESKGGNSSSSDSQCKDAEKSTSEDKTNKDEGGKRKGDKEKSTEPESKRRKRDEEDDDDRSSLSSSMPDRSDRAAKKKPEPERRKFVSVDKAGLLAWVYYDTTHAGYVVDKDLEDMMYSLGLQISRAQVRALVQKVCPNRGEGMHYRKLTDKLESSPDVPAAAAPTVDINVPKLAQGNRRSADAADAAGAQSSQADGVVMYRGAVLELDKVMDKLERSESSRLQVEGQMRSVQEESDSLKTKLERSEERTKRLSNDIRWTSDRLNSTKAERNRREDELSGMMDVLHSASSQLHRVTRLVDSTLVSEEPEGKQGSSERYTPSKEPPPETRLTPNGKTSPHTEGLTVKEELTVKDELPCESEDLEAADSSTDKMDTNEPADKEALTDAMTD